MYRRNDALTRNISAYQALDSLFQGKTKNKLCDVKANNTASDTDD